MLLRIEKKILKVLSKRPSEIEVCVDKFPKYDRDDIYRALLSLQEKEYVSNVTTVIDRSLFQYELTTKGQFYREQHFKEFLSNIIIPAVVSVVTTLITMYITGELTLPPAN